MREKNAFSYLVFLDSHGDAEISGEELLRAFDEERNIFIMDYIDPRIGYTGKMDCRMLDPNELQRALDAFQMFRGKMSFPANYEEHLRAELQNKRNPKNYQLQASTVP